MLCAASLEDKPPPWLRGQGRGWVTAEYAMLPRATSTRTRRESSTGKVSGRTQEIQRLIGRSLRAVVDLPQARRAADHDRLRRAAGGRRHAHGRDHRAFLVAMRDCLAWMAQPLDPQRQSAQGPCGGGVLRRPQGEAVLDLDYAEDSTAETDANFVMTGSGGLVEVQGSAEGAPFTEAQLLAMLALARGGVTDLVKLQKAAVG